MLVVYTEQEGWPVTVSDVKAPLKEAARLPTLDYLEITMAVCNIVTVQNLRFNQLFFEFTHTHTSLRQSQIVWRPSEIWRTPKCIPFQTSRSNATVNATSEREKKMP